MFAVDSEVLQQALREERTSDGTSSYSSSDEAGDRRGFGGESKRYRLNDTRKGLEEREERRKEVISGLPAAIQVRLTLNLSSW